MVDPISALREELRDRYELERELGRGGMATVYLARDLRHDRPVALKVLHPELAASLGPERFQREIRLAARLQHPHILTVLDSGEVAGRGRGAVLWFTMPFVEGESLRDRLRRERQLPVEDALRIAREAAEALDYAHRAGRRSTATSSRRTSCSPDGHALVADFGIARALGAAGDEQLTETGLAVGTPAYMSPGAGRGRRDARRADRHLLAGGVLYEMLAGEPPFTGPTAQAIDRPRLTEPRAERPGGAARRCRRRWTQAVRKALAQVAGGPVRDARRSSRGARCRATPRAADRGAAAAARGRAPPTPAPPRPPSPPAPARRGSLALGFLLGLGVLFGWLRAIGDGRPATRAAPSGSPCSRSRTWATRTTSTSPTASPTRCGASWPRCPGSRSPPAAARPSTRRPTKTPAGDRAGAGRGLPPHRHGALGERRAAAAGCG